MRFNWRRSRSRRVPPPRDYALRRLLCDFPLGVSVSQMRKASGWSQEELDAFIEEQGPLMVPVEMPGTREPHFGLTKRGHQIFEFSLLIHEDR